MIMLGKSGVVDVRINRRSGGPSTLFFGGEGKRTSFFFFPFPEKKPDRGLGVNLLKKKGKRTSSQSIIKFLGLYFEIQTGTVALCYKKKLENYFWICS